MFMSHFLRSSGLALKQTHDTTACCISESIISLCFFKPRRKIMYRSVYLATIIYARRIIFAIFCNKCLSRVLRLEVVRLLRIKRPPLRRGMTRLWHAGDQKKLTTNCWIHQQRLTNTQTAQNLHCLRCPDSIESERWICSLPVGATSWLMYFPELEIAGSYLSSYAFFNQ